MSVEDRTMARLVMRELGRRRHLDLTDVKVSVSRGVAYIAGIIRPSLGEWLDPKAEMKAIMDGCKRVPGLRDVAFEAKFDQGAKK
ncbi:MAG TPA: hypothetical protein PK794_00825 [Armatimonadota bacterium]|nr:hypothetical protein [Armatimonadota bacterium]